MRFKEKFTEKWVAATQVEEIRQQFGGWVLAKNKTGHWLVKENYTQGHPNYGVLLGDDQDPDFLAVRAAFDNADTNLLHENFEVAYTSFSRHD